MIKYLKDRPLRVFNTPWHVAHQYEIYKIPGLEIFHIINSVRRWSDTGKTFRPMQSNITQVPYYEPGKYDVALLHVDQQCIDQSIGKARLYKQLNEEIKDIPKIVINHGTPYWPEQYTTDYIRTAMKMLIGNNFVVYNSHRAQEMWGPMGKDPRTIIHGLDAQEWLDLPKEPRVITMLSQGGLDKYYNRRLLDFVRDKLRERGVGLYQITVDVPAMPLEEYREFVGRSLVYFNPTLESPMPRSRTEAMLSGCCVVTLANHGAELFIENGVNGFLFPNLDPSDPNKTYDPIVIVDLIENLIKENYQKAEEIGKRGKETAQLLFSKDRFQADWGRLLNDVLGEKIYDIVQN